MSSINLISPESTSRKLTRKILILWTFLWVIGLTALAFVAQTSWSQSSRLVNERMVLEERNENLISQLTQTKLLKEEIELLKTQHETIHKLANKRPLLTLFSTLATSRGTEGRVFVNDLRLKQDAQRTNSYTLTLLGKAIDHSSVATFASSLRESKRFANVELRSVGNVLVADQPASDYNIECEF